MLPKPGTGRCAFARVFLSWWAFAFAFAFAVHLRTSWTSCTTSVSALVAEPPRQGGSSCALRTAEQVAGDKPFVTNPLPRPSHSCLLSSLLKTLSRMPFALSRSYIGILDILHPKNLKSYLQLVAPVIKSLKQQELMFVSPVPNTRSLRMLHPLRCRRQRPSTRPCRLMSSGCAGARPSSRS